MITSMDSKSRRMLRSAVIQLKRDIMEAIVEHEGELSKPAKAKKGSWFEEILDETVKPKAKTKPKSTNQQLLDLFKQQTKPKAKTKPKKKSTNQQLLDLFKQQTKPKAKAQPKKKSTNQQMLDMFKQLNGGGKKKQAPKKKTNSKKKTGGAGMNKAKMLKLLLGS